MEEYFRHDNNNNKSHLKLYLSGPFLSYNYQFPSAMESSMLNFNISQQMMKLNCQLLLEYVCKYLTEIEKNPRDNNVEVCAPLRFSLSTDSHNSFFANNL